MRVLFLILLYIIYPQTDVSNLKLWDSNSKIVWSNFTGEIPENKDFKKAVTSTKISIRSDFYEGDIPTYIVRSFFDKNASWTITDSEKHLEHERLHFEITELYSRKIRKKLDSLSKNGERNINCYKVEYKKIIEDYKVIQKQYDGEVYSSDIRQKEWIDEISKELEKLKKYEFIIKE